MSNTIWKILVYPSLLPGRDYLVDWDHTDFIIIGVEFWRIGTFWSADNFRLLETLYVTTQGGVTNSRVHVVTAGKR